MHGFSKSLGILVAMVALGWADPAGAQTDQEKASARTLAGQGLDAFKGDRFQQAIDLFSRAESLVHSPNHLLYIARSQTKLGQLVRARETYVKIKRDQVPADAPAAFHAAKENALKELKELEGRLSYLTIEVSNPKGGDVTVELDGKQVPPALIGVQQPLDPGEHQVRAFAPGMASEPVAVTLLEGKNETVQLELTASSDTPTAPEAPVEGEDTGTTPVEGEVGMDSGGGASGLQIGGFVGVGVGVVGLALGTAFGLKTNSSKDKINKICDLPEGRCPLSRNEEVAKLQDDSSSTATLSTVGFIVGGVGIAAGTTLLILHYTGGSSDEEAGIHPYIGPGSAGVTGRF